MKIGTIIKLLLVLSLSGVGCMYFLNTLKQLAVVAVAKTGIAPNSVPGTVLVRAEKEMNIRSDLAGRVIESKLELGKKVKEGDILLALDLGDLELQIEKVKIDISAADLIRKNGSPREINLVVAREKLIDAQRRFDAGGISQLALTTNERTVTEIEKTVANDINSMEVKIAQLQNGLKRLERQNEKMSIRSPVDGVITEVFAYRGDLVRSAQEVAKIISLDRVVEVQVSEENFAGVEVGQVARIKFLGYGSETFSATVSKTLPVADPTTQRYTIHLKVDNIEDEKLFPGLTGESTITLDERPGAVIIPASAIIGDKVFFVNEGIVSIIQVEEGYGSMTSIEIRSGLSAGDQVIVEQLELFKEGDSVRVTTKSF